MHTHNKLSKMGDGEQSQETASSKETASCPRQEGDKGNSGRTFQNQMCTGLEAATNLLSRKLSLSWTLTLVHEMFTFLIQINHMYMVL